MIARMLEKSIFTIFLCIIWISNGKVYGLSENFKFVIDTIGIPQYNVYGKEINEEIYKAYNVFSYGWPEELGSDVGQRWKNSIYGLWAQNKGAYSGIGTRGEYNLLGKDYSGNVINNYYFPVDILPDTTPEYWEYYSNPGALDSWNDSNKYKYKEQLEYMKNTKLLFNDISSKDNADNPEKIKEYNITASKIGFDKARLDVCSTWKTNGIIHTRRKVGNNIRYAVFLTNPMAANANVQSNIEVSKSFWVMKSNQNKISITINHGSEIVNMTGYAKKEHIKEIMSKLYVNGILVDEISGSKTDIVGKKYILRLSREDLLENQDNIIEIVNDSYAHTEFAVDGLMQDSTKKYIKVFVDKKEVIPLKLHSIKILEKENDTLVVRPLTQTNITSVDGSSGVTEAGKYLAVKLDINDDIKYEDLENITVHFNDAQIEEFEINKSDVNDNFCVCFKIPNDINSTIFGWKSLRDLYGNYFDIDESRVGERIGDPHNISIKVIYKEKEYSISFKLDTIDDYITNINYRYNNKVNTDEEILNMKDWLLT